MKEIRAQFQNGNEVEGLLGVVGETWANPHECCWRTVLQRNASKHVLRVCQGVLFIEQNADARTACSTNAFFRTLASRDAFRRGGLRFPGLEIQNPGRQPKGTTDAGSQHCLVSQL